MNKRDAIEILKSMLPEKISYAELVGAVGCYGNGGYVYADPEPYAIEMAILALEKQIPRKPEWTPAYQSYFSAGDEAEPLCPVCGELIEDEQQICLDCYQVIDWSVEE